MRAVDFNSDLTKQYEFIRLQLAKDDESLIAWFGPPEIDINVNEAISEEESHERSENSNKQKKQIQLGYTRVLAKIKKIRH